MTAEQCVAFLEAIRAKNIRIKSNGWVEASCPLAPFLHQSRKDVSPSFGLSIHPGERSRFSCFTCRSGSAEELLHALEMYTHNHPHYDFKLAHQLLNEELDVLPLPAYAEFHQPEKLFNEWPQYWLDSFQKADWSTDAMTYLLGRGVSQTTVAQFNLRWDAKRQMVMAPYWDVYGRFAGARGRSVLPEPPHKHFDYSWQGSNNAGLVWYNEPVLNQHGPVVVVEGQFDLWRTATVFPKVVAALTAKPTWAKFKKLADCPVIVQIPDRDDAGKASTDLYAKFCHKLGVDYRVVWLDESLDGGKVDPDMCSPDYLKDKIYEVIEV